MDPLAERRALVEEVASCRDALPRFPTAANWPTRVECRSTYHTLLELVDAYDDHGLSDHRAATVVVRELADTARCDFYVPMFTHRRAFVDHMGPDIAARVFRDEDVTPADERAAARALIHHRSELTEHLLATQSTRELCCRAVRRAIPR